MKRMIKLAALLLTAAIVSALCGCGTPVVGRLGEPREDIGAFFEALAAEDYDTADGYLYNYRSLGFEKGSGEASEDTDAAGMMLRAVGQSRRCEVTACEVSGREASVTVELTVLDLGKLSAALDAAVADEVAARRLAGDACDDPSEVEALAAEMLENLLEQPGDHLTSDSFVLEMIHDAGRWRIVMTDELYAALCGYAV